MSGVGPFSTVLTNRPTFLAQLANWLTLG